MKKFSPTIVQLVYADVPNSLDAFVPEVWAAESLMILENNMVAASLVHRDFSPDIANFGDTINTRLPAEFTAERKVDADSVTIQAADATNVPVVLNQHLHTSFLIKDGEESKGFKSLRDLYLEPALLSISQQMDQIVLGQKYEFIGNVVGQLATTPTRKLLIDAEIKMDDLKVPTARRNMIISPTTKGDLLNIDDFIHAEKRGDGGTALREGSLGRVFGFDTYMDQNQKTIAATDVLTRAVNNAAGYAAGSTSIAWDGSGGTPVAGSWLTIAGDMTPQFITSVGTPFVISPGLANAVADDAVITVYEPAIINLGAGYAAAHAKDMVVDSATLPPRLGQMLTTGVTTGTRNEYGGIGSSASPSTTSILANRPLDAAVADDAVVGLGPAGSYSWAFDRMCMSLVTRPLALPANGLALSGVQSHNGIGIRVVITYDGSLQGHLVTVDLLAGVKTLDSNRGCLVLS